MALDHPADALPARHRLDGYEILRVLGRGGFGLTYQARREGSSGQMVAIKELFPHGSVARGRNFEVVPCEGSDRELIDASIDMFHREAHLICTLDHPNIVRGLEAFREHGTAYLVMDYMTGRTLHDSLRDPAGFKPGPSTMPALLDSLLGGLEALHQVDLHHGDIKPDNIFLGVGFEPILIDLGSARSHEPGRGTVGPGTYSQYFSAIEQVDERFGSVGPWTDLYQLSAVAYRCIAGGKLPDAKDRVEASDDDFVPLTEMEHVVRVYPRRFLEAIDRGLAPLPKERPQSVAEFRKIFGDVLPSQSRRGRKARGGRSPGSPNHPGSRPPVDYLLLAAGALAVLIIVLIFLILFK